MQSVPAGAIARTSTAMNIIRQGGGVDRHRDPEAFILASQINSRLGIHGHGSHGGFAAVSHLSPAAQARIKGPLAAAFAHSFVYAVGLLVVAFLPALAMAIYSRGRAAPAQTGAPVVVE